MPPKTRSAAKSKKQTSNHPDIPEEEQWRIIQESGLLQQIPQEKRQESRVVTDDEEDGENPFAEELFNAVILIVPFTSLLILMEILVRQQYGQRTSFKNLADRVISGVPILSIFIFYSNRYKLHRRMKFFVFLLSMAVGPRLIYLVNKANWITNMKQAPPLATLWVYTIVQMDLGPSVLSLCIVGVWYWWSGYKFSFH